MRISDWSSDVCSSDLAGATLYNALVLKVPAAEVTGAVGVLALLANAGVADLPFAYRKGDDNMRSVWICSRNDALANVSVVLAARGVFGCGPGSHEVVVAAVIAVLSLWGGGHINREARARPQHFAVPRRRH